MRKNGAQYHLVRDSPGILSLVYIRITARLSTYKVKGTVSTEVIEIPSDDDDDDDDDEAPAHIAYASVYFINVLVDLGLYLWCHTVVREKKSILGEVLDLEPMPGAWPNQKSNQHVSIIVYHVSRINLL